jgi:hypothetical protein
MAKNSDKQQKTKRSKWMYVLDAFAVVATVGLVSFGIWTTTQKNASEGPCTKPGEEHILTLKDDAFSSAELDVRQCDILKIVNADKELNYVLAFGVHEKHIEYPGFTEQSLRPNEFLVVDAVEAGRYRMHDHIRDNAAVNITIRANDSD